MCGRGGIPGDSVPVSGPPPDSDLVDLSEHPQLGLFALSRLTCPVSQQHIHCALDPSPPGPHSCSALTRLCSTFLSLSPPASCIGHLTSTY